MAGMRLVPIAAAALLLGSCGSPKHAADAAPSSTAEGPNSTAASTLSPTVDSSAGERWNLQSSGRAVSLTLLPTEGGAIIGLTCPSGANLLLVNVPGFKPIGSEERLSFGSAGDAVVLVADRAADAEWGGVRGAGEVPDNLSVLIGGPLSASYGAQTSGPHPAPPEDLSRAFVTACRPGSIVPVEARRRAAASTSACLVQGSESVGVRPHRAVGTEPFWAARTYGRCVIYSHPENPDGTRVWTRYTKRSDADIWVGALDGQLFELRTRREAGCSDGMSNRRYPLAAEVVVHGEWQRGCAEPL